VPQPRLLLVFRVHQVGFLRRAVVQRFDFFALNGGT
jgi:hypothetical protein